MTITEQIESTLAQLGQAAADYAVSVLLDGSAIVRFDDAGDLAASEATLQDAGLLVEQQDESALHVWSINGIGVEPLGELLPESSTPPVDGVGEPSSRPSSRGRA
jgi:hypothetical protein